MPITIAAVGSYPKAPREGRPFALGRAIDAFRAGEIGRRQLRGAEDDFVEEIIDEQVRAGVGLVTDGQVRWPDLPTPFARRMRGFTVPAETPGSVDGDLPPPTARVTRTVDWGGPVTIDDWAYASSVARVAVKQVIVGPYTLVRHARNEHYASERELVLDVARVLNQEAFELEAAGCTYIQFDEPALTRNDAPGWSGDFGLVAEAADVLTNGIAVTTEIRTYFGPVKQPEDFFSLPFRAFGLDFVEGPANWDLLKHFPGGRILAAGLVGRGPDVEDEESLRDDVRRLLEVVPPGQLHLTPSSGLGHLRRAYAEAKLTRLAAAARAAV